MASSLGKNSESYHSRSNQTRDVEAFRRREELAALLAFWSDDEPVVDPDVSQRLYERERDCELTLSGSLDLVKQNPQMIWSHVADALQELHIARLKLKTYDANKIRETLNIWRGLVAFDKKRGSSLALALTSFGRLYCSVGRYADAEQACLEAINLYREILTDNPKEGRESGFFTMICLAETYCETDRYDDAERALRMATGFLKKISFDRPRYEFVLDRMRRRINERSQKNERADGNVYRRDEAFNCRRDASRLWRWGSLQEAETFYRKAISIYRDPTAMENDVERRVCLAETLDELGRLCCQPKFAKYNEAEAFFTESVSIQRELSALDAACSDSFATALLNLATYYERQRRGEELERTLREALKTLETRDGEFNSIVPSAHARLANWLRRSNRAEEAVDEYCLALELWNKAQGSAAQSCRVEVATTRFRLAELYKHAKRWDEAEESYDAAQKLFRELYEHDRDSYAHKLASSLNNLATLRSNSERGQISDVGCMIAEGNYAEALALYRNLREKDSNSVQFEFATALYNSALLHEKLNAADVAEKEYLEALEIQRGLAKEQPGEYAENVARILNNLAVLYRADLSDPLRSEKAEPLYEEALRIYESLEREQPKKYRRKIVRTLRNLASVHSQDPDRKELAEEEYRRAATLLLDLIRLFPDFVGYKSDLADVYSRLGAAYFEAGSFNDAKLRYLDSLAKYRELTRINPRKYFRKLAGTFNALRELYQTTGAFSDVLQISEAIVNIYEKASHEEPNDRTLRLKLAASNYRLALACQKLGQDERARDAYLANLSVLNELSQGEGADFRLDKARAHNNLAIVDQKLNRIEDAENEYESAVGLYRELEQDEPGAYGNELTKTFNNLAVLYQESGRLEEAEQNFIDALAIRRKLAEENPQEYKPFLANSLFNLSSFYFDQGRLREAEASCREAVSIFEEFSSDDEGRRNLERATTKLRGIRDEIEEREINNAFVKQSDEYPLATLANIRDRVAYVYVSSVGDAMGVERDYLAQEIFPRIRLYCRRLGIEFAPIDLRYGEDDMDDARVLALGLQEIERTRPFFIGLVGDEYGRILESSELEQNSEFQRVVLSDQDLLDTRMSALEAEFQFGVMREAQKVDAFLGLRSFQTEANGARVRYEKPGTDSFKKLTTLKRKLRAQKLHPTFEYESLEQLGEELERALVAWINRLWEFESGVPNPRDAAQKRFAERLRQYYAPNESDYDALDTFALSDSSVLAIVGAPGVGKSSLLANWSERVSQGDSKRRVVTYYVGADGQYEAPSKILSFFTETLTGVSTNKTATLEERKNAFSAAVATFLKASAEKEIIFVIDGLNRLTDAGESKNLTWLPRLPKRAKYLLSTLENDVTLENVIRRGWNVYEKRTSTEARFALIRELTEEYSLDWSEERQAQIVDLSFASNLHFLRAFLKTFGGTGEITDETFAQFGACRSTDEFLEALLAQIEREFEGNDGEWIANRDFASTATLPAASSCGLTLEELRRASGFSTFKILAILKALNGILSVQGDRRRFVSDQIREFALDRYAQYAPEARRRLIEICESDDELSYELEVPFQFFQLGDYNRLKTSLINFERFVSLYDGTKSCDFCKYWEASNDAEGRDYRFDEYFNLDLSSKTREEIGVFGRALGDVARSYQDVPTAENAWRRALNALCESTSDASEFLLVLTRLSALLCEQERFVDAERELRAGLEFLTAQNVSDDLNAPILLARVKLATLCRRLGRPEESEKICVDALTLAESTNDEHGLASATVELARAYYDLRRFEQARQAYENALNLLRNLSSDNPHTFERQVATTLREFARLPVENTSSEETERNLLEAESIYRKLEQDERGAYDFELASTFDEFARLYFQASRFEEADEKSRTATSIWRELVLKDARFNENLASTLEFSARICFELQDFEDAENALQDALEIRRTQREGRGIAKILCNLGNLCRRRENWRGAEQYWLEARDIYRNLSTEEQDVYPEDQARILTVLGDLYLLLERLDLAEENYCDALVIYRGLVRKDVGNYDFELASLLNELGDVCWTERRASDSEGYYREALEFYLDVMKESPREYKGRVAKITRRLAFIDVEAGRVEDAERELTQALNWERELVHEESKDATNELAEILYALANIHFDDDRLNEAEIEYQEALSLLRRQEEESPGKFKREVAATLAALATLHRRVDRLSESDAEFQIALDLYRDLAKDEPQTFKPKLAFVLKNLAELHVEFNRRTKADVEFGEAATIYRELNGETYGAFDRELVSTLRRWAEFCRDSNRLADAGEKYSEVVELCRKTPVENRGEDYFDALSNLADLLSLNDENDEALNVYRELVQAYRRQGAMDRTSTLRLVDALRKSASLRFDVGDYALVAEEYEALAVISHVLASPDFEERARELLRAYEILNVAYDK